MRRFNHSITPLLSIISSLIVSNVCLADGPAVFNGKDIGNWTADDPAMLSHWTVSDGMLVGENADKEASNLWTKQDYGDYELELEYLTPSQDYDSGVYARGGSHQIQIGVSRSLGKDMTACIYAPKDDRGKYPAVSDKIEAVHNLGEWNALKIVAKGKRLQTFLNGEEFVDYETVVMPEKGPIGLQLHKGVHQKMFFRNIKLKELH